MLNEAQVKAVEALREGLEHMDRYTPTVVDDDPVFVVRDSADNTLLEFATDRGRLQLGHLRDILSIFQGE